LFEKKLGRNVIDRSLLKLAAVRTDPVLILGAHVRLMFASMIPCFHAGTPVHRHDHGWAPVFRGREGVQHLRRRPPFRDARDKGNPQAGLPTITLDKV